MVDRTYDWNGHIGLPISYSHLTDHQMAGTVRMLMRSDLGHEGIVCGARDRIMCLVKEKAALEARITELEAGTPSQVPQVAVSVLRKASDDSLPTAEDVRGILSTIAPAPNFAALLEKAVEALRPLSDAVFNDNGDMLVSRPLPSYDECVKAYFVAKQIRIALETPPAPQAMGSDA